MFIRTSFRRYTTKGGDLIIRKWVCLFGGQTAIFLSGASVEVAVPRTILGSGRRHVGLSGNDRNVFMVAAVAWALFVGAILFIIVPLAVYPKLNEGEAAPLIWALSSFGTTVFLSMLLAVCEWQRRKLARSVVSASHRSESYSDIIEAYFIQWKLTRSERTVAVYVMKGFSNSEIASLRQTSEATIKSQLNAIYRKAGVTSRQQLACFIFEDFIQLQSDEDTSIKETVAAIGSPRLVALK